MPTRMWNGCKFLSIDPGINHTGLATYKVEDGKPKLITWSAISPNAREECDIERAGFIVDSTQATVNLTKPAFVFLERPPNTIYYQGKSSPGMLIARAQSVFKVIGVTYAIAIRLRNFTGLKTILVDPVKWQERSKAKRDGLNIKDWSLRLANSLITQLTTEVANLHTERDINIADAICMGYIAFSKNMAE
jgi:hypothetical protein